MADTESPSGARLRALCHDALSNELNKRSTAFFSSDNEPELKVQPGSDKSELAHQFQRILLNAEQQGYKATLADAHFGLGTIRRNDVVEAHAIEQRIWRVWTSWHDNSALRTCARPWDT